MNLAGLIKVGSVWREVADVGVASEYPSERVKVVSLDLDTDYPVQFQNINRNSVGYGSMMRDTIRCFIDDYVPDQGWADLLEDLP